MATTVTSLDEIGGPDGTPKSDQDNVQNRIPLLKVFNAVPTHF